MCITTTTVVQKGTISRKRIFVRELDKSLFVVIAVNFNFLAALIKRLFLLKKYISSKTSYKTNCPSPDRSRNPFVSAAAGTKDWNG
jgi:hypothetical protein